MDMNNLKIGVIGAGNMGLKHINIYKEFWKDAELVGFFDIDNAKGEGISKIYNTVAFPKIDDLLENVDAVTIAVPASFHYKYGLLCAQKGKHILMEKPICKTALEAQMLINACKEKDVILQVGHIERFSPVNEELMKILKNEDIISLDFKRLSPYDERIQDTDVIHDLMIHDIDIMNWIINSSVKTILAQGKHVYNERYLDYAQALIEFSNGILVSLTSSRITEDRVRMLTINTKNSYICVDYLNKKISISRRGDLKVETGYTVEYTRNNILENVYVKSNNNPLKDEINSFIQSIQNKQNPLVDGLEGLKAVQIADKVSKTIISKS